MAEDAQEEIDALRQAVRTGSAFEAAAAKGEEAPSHPFSGKGFDTISKQLKINFHTEDFADIHEGMSKSLQAAFFGVLKTPIERKM